MAARVVCLNGTHWNAASQRFIYRLNTIEKFEGYKVGLKSLNLLNSFKNIAAANYNNTLTFRFNAHFTKNPLTGVTLGSAVEYWDFTITIPDGFYEVSDINYYIQSIMVDYKLYVNQTGSKFNVYFFEMIAQTTAYAIQINFFPIADTDPSGYIIPSGAAWTWGSELCPRLSITQPNMAILLGIPVGTYGNGATETSTLGTCPQINAVSAVYLGLNLINDSMNLPTDTFFQQPVNKSYGQSISENEGSILWRDVAPSSGYSTVEIVIRDQNQNILNLVDFNAQFSIALLPPPLR